MKRLVCAAMLALISAPGVAQTSQTSHGDCSPNIANNPGTITFTCNIIQYTSSGKLKDLKLVYAELPPNNEGGKHTKEITGFFDQLQKLDNEFVYFRVHTYVGAGFGLKDLPRNQAIKAGVVYDLDLDGFGGNAEDYKGGYRIDLDGYRKQWGLNRTSTILFPKSGNAFFDTHRMKSIVMDGLAKIRLSDMQGYQFIEVVPAQPFGDLMARYDKVREKLPKRLRSEF
jgi:hypothetical protein